MAKRMLLIAAGVVGAGAELVPVDDARYVEIADTFKGKPEDVERAIDAGFVTAHPVGKRSGKAKTEAEGGKTAETPTINTPAAESKAKPAAPKPPPAKPAAK